MSTIYKISSGDTHALGATITKTGVNFAIWCRYASAMELLLFKDVDDKHPDIITLDNPIYRSSYYWHVHVQGLKDGQLYGWRVKSVVLEEPGCIFDSQKVLIDPYAKRIVFPSNYNRTYSCFVGSNIEFCAKSVVIDMSKYDWEGDGHPRIPLSSNVIYELHVAGFTKDPSCKIDEKIRGTYAGLVDKIAYFKDLGINAVELLPIFQFDKDDALPGKTNYWGYSPMSFFAIHGDYSSVQDIYGPLDEFRDMVKAFHKAGIEVFLDVVYNHTSEGGKTGPLYSFKALDNRAYYILDDNYDYKNYSGCGNTINASHPMVKRMITDSLHFWAEEMHVDGFRFDLASILSRSLSGEPLSDPPTTLSIDADYSLADVKLIAEPWDAGGLYQVGQMAGKKWREWNGHFRDDMRCFLRGDANMIHKFVNRLLGSPDIYNIRHTDPQKSINFVTCHDGFTLWDVVSYNQKHNEANGENNRDGNDWNCSSNYGVEGPTDDPKINEIRLRQAKNFMLLNVFSMGTPMILMGDECLRTQYGNNNAYCQDNPLSYMKWNIGIMQKEMYNFTKNLLSYRTLRGRLTFGQMYTLGDAIRRNRIIWHGTKPHEPDWSESSHSIGFTVYSDSHRCYYYMFVNAYWEGLHLKLPNVPEHDNQKWFRVVDTSLAPPNDVHARGDALPTIGHNYYIKARSILVLAAPCVD